MKNEDIFVFVENVETRGDFILFVDMLTKYYEKNSDGWENRDLPSYLSAVRRFTEDISGYYKNRGEEADVEELTWNMAARILLAGSIYS